MNGLKTAAECREQAAVEARRDFDKVLTHLGAPQHLVDVVRHFVTSEVPDLAASIKACGGTAHRPAVQKLMLELAEKL